jgi:hypothetical protein
MNNQTVRSVSSRTIPPELVIEIKGTRAHIGKSCAAEVCRRALEKAGFLDVAVQCQDGDSDMFRDRDLSGFSAIASRVKVTIIDNNERPTRSDTK